MRFCAAKPGTDFAYYQGNVGRKVFRMNGLYQCCRYRGFAEIERACLKMRDLDILKLPRIQFLKICGLELECIVACMIQRLFLWFNAG
jgi:hypothetical protein